MMRGGWNYRLPPLPGELLSSCLARNAHAHGCAPYRFLNMFWEGDPVWNRDFDRDPAGLSRSGRRPHVPDWPDDFTNPSTLASAVTIPIRADGREALRLDCCIAPDIRKTMA